MEYWITKQGDVIYCDGDAGIDVPNHEMIVKAECLEIAIASLEMANDWRINHLIDAIRPLVEEGCIDTPMLRQAIFVTADSLNREGALSDDEVDDFLEWMRKRAGISEGWEWKCAWTDSIDERKHAIDNWKWIRVAHRSVQLPNLRPATLRRLEEGLEEAFDDVERLRFHIEAGNQFFPDTPYMAIAGLKSSRYTQSV